MTGLGTPGRNACIQGQLTLRVLILEIDIVVRKVTLDVALPDSDVAAILGEGLIVAPQLGSQLLAVRVDIVKRYKGLEALCKGRYVLCIKIDNNA